MYLHMNDSDRLARVVTVSPKSTVTIAPKPTVTIAPKLRRRSGFSLWKPFKQDESIQSHEELQVPTVSIVRSSRSVSRGRSRQKIPSHTADNVRYYTYTSEAISRSSSSSSASSSSGSSRCSRSRSPRRSNSPQPSHTSRASSCRSSSSRSSRSTAVSLGRSLSSSSTSTQPTRVKCFKRNGVTYLSKPRAYSSTDAQSVSDITDLSSRSGSRARSSSAQHSAFRRSHLHHSSPSSNGTSPLLQSQRWKDKDEPHVERYRIVTKTESRNRRDTELLPPFDYRRLSSHSNEPDRISRSHSLPPLDERKETKPGTCTDSTRPRRHRYSTTYAARDSSPLARLVPPEAPFTPPRGKRLSTRRDISFMSPGSNYQSPSVQDVTDEEDEPDSRRNNSPSRKVRIQINGEDERTSDSGLRIFDDEEDNFLHSETPRSARDSPVLPRPRSVLKNPQSPPTKSDSLLAERGSPSPISRRVDSRRSHELGRR